MAGTDWFIMLPCRYEDLKKQLLRVSELAQQEDDEKELAQATAAVARLTAPAPASPWPRKGGDNSVQVGSAQLLRCDTLVVGPVVDLGCVALFLLCRDTHCLL